MNNVVWKLLFRCKGLSFGYLENLREAGYSNCFYKSYYDSVDANSGGDLVLLLAYIFSNSLS